MRINEIGEDKFMKSLPADDIHQRLCDLRNGTGKSQKEVADDLNMQASVLSRMLEHPYFPMILDTVNAYFNEEYNVGYANRNAIIDIGTMNLKDLAKNSLERRIELQHGIREINAQKITGTEADFEKIKSIFMAMLKDIKKEYDVPHEDISMVELKQQLKLMNEQALM